MWRRYTCVRQDDQSDCGAAALATIALHHRLPVPLERMRNLSGTDRHGVNLRGLQSAAQQLGFATKAVKGTWEALSQQSLPLPLIAHVRLPDGVGHFVVVHRIEPNKVVVADPAKGLRTLTRDEFLASWTGYLMLAVPDPVQSEAAKDLARGGAEREPWRRFTQLIGAQRGVLIEIVACAVFMTFLGISTSYFVQHLVDSVLVRGETRMLNALGLGMAVVLTFRTLLSMLRQYLLAHVGRRIDMSLMSQYTRHLLRLPQSFFDSRQIGETLSRVHDAMKVREAVGGAALTVLVDGVLVVFTTCVLWAYDGPLALVATLFGPLLLVIVLLHHPSARRRSRRAMEEAADVSAHLVENIAGVATFKACTAQDRRADESEDRLVRLSRAVYSMQMLNLSLSTAGGLVSATAGVVILWLGGHRVIEGALTIGELMFFYTLLGYMLEPLQRLAGVNIQIQDALVAVDRLYQVLDLAGEDSPTDTPHAPTSDKATLAPIATGIEFQDVSFRYGCREAVLAHVNLTIPAGATVAIVGESGCGKSTLLKLLARFYEPTGGRIRIDGIDIRDIDVDSLRSRIGIVSQEPFVFSGTIRQNIALGRPEASLNDIIAAARAAGLDEFISSLPQRYESIIGERGGNLSGGQRQRLAIARALLCDPEILLFDEATSHLDTATEQSIQDNLRTVFAQRTVILVAHRLSTIREADFVCVVDKGQIVELGTHLELLQRDGRYARLWRSQASDDGHVDRPWTNRIRNMHPIQESIATRETH